ncbi:MAG: hypothetical protein A2Z95_01315 [Gallionellales bacterium GWA2_60_18]|nr:MAG: hypothetical protein A2Z95_01315 [Gallionellales bacterium GWA2_60_18]
MIFPQIQKPVLALILAASCQAAWAGPEEDYTSGYDMYYKKGDVVEAMPLLTKAADAGYAPAQATLGGILDYSEYDEDAIAYYRKAADQGNAEGQFGLGSMLSIGEGAPKDTTEARRLIALAAEQGHKQAVSVLAQAYISGKLDIPENERQGAEAQRWIKLSAEDNYLPAIDALIKAYREGGLGLEANAAEAERWQAKSYELQGLNKKGQRKRAPKK